MDSEWNNNFLFGAQMIEALIYILLADMYLFPLLTFLLVIFSFIFRVEEISRTLCGLWHILEVSMALRLFLLMLRFWEVYCAGDRQTYPLIFSMPFCRPSAKWI